MSDWPLIPPSSYPSGSSISSSGVGSVPAYKQSYLGKCINRPFRRDLKNDFANVEGVALVTSAIGQILGTFNENGITRGELPWDTDFGSALILLHHKNPDEVFEQLARVYIEESLKIYEPRAITKSVIMAKKIVDGESHVTLTVRFDVASSNTPGSAILAKDLSLSIPLS